VGETLEPGLDPRHRFDRIACFEAVKSCCAILEKQADERVEVCRFGFWNETSRLPIYGTGALRTILFRNGDPSGQTEMVELRSASDWSREHISKDDEVFFMRRNHELGVHGQSQTIFPAFPRPALGDEIHWAVQEITQLGSVGTLGGPTKGRTDAA
jgi:hypothetical protein